MNKIALYQKYRPNNLEEMVGQDHVKKTLANSVRDGRLSHAYLFTGIRGTGKTSLARILGKIVNCEDAPRIDYSNDDKYIKMINAGKFPDIRELDAASNNSIDDIREIRREAYNVPMIGKKRVFIIDECLPKGSLIKMRDGNVKSIEDIVKSKEDEYVLSYNFEKNTIEEKKVIRKITIPNDKIMKKIKIKNKNGVIKFLYITENHKVFNKNGEKIKVKNLKIGNNLLLKKQKE